MSLAWAQSPMGDDRWHRNHGADKMEGMCRDHSQVWPRVVRWEGAQHREKQGLAEWLKLGGLPEKRSLAGGEDIMISLNIMWKGGCLIQGVTQRTESGRKVRGVAKVNLSSGSQKGGLVRK